MSCSSSNSVLSPPKPLLWLRSIIPIAILTLTAVFYRTRVLAFPVAADLIKTPSVIAQDDSDSDESEVPPAEVEKYIAVYKAMQRDRSLTAETAAAQSGMTLEAFRRLEARVQRDAAALQRAREELQAAAKKAASAGSP
jgi:hypothetical protein